MEKENWWHTIRNLRHNKFKEIQMLSRGCIAHMTCIDNKQTNLKFFIRWSGFGWFMAFNATFNNISVISWQSVLLVEETGFPGENH